MEVGEAAAAAMTAAAAAAGTAAAAVVIVVVRVTVGAGKGDAIVDTAHTAHGRVTATRDTRRGTYFERSTVAEEPAARGLHSHYGAYRLRVREPNPRCEGCAGNVAPGRDARCVFQRGGRRGTDAARAQSRAEKRSDGRGSEGCDARDPQWVHRRAAAAEGGVSAAVAVGVDVVVVVITAVPAAVDHEKTGLESADALRTQRTTVLGRRAGGRRRRSGSSSSSSRG
jgi:hypothetical protein